MDKKIDRAAVIKLHLAGKQTNFISKQLKIADRTVRYIVNRYKELGTLEDRPKSWYS